ncbi:mRNA-capping enzyme subunit beta [Trichoderma lentiforme]|uniref:mRNA-capping enzyme subunit beta n=1 Tax=Trichoderma lentiforme TaxID=1567552 RepID=A0A9P4X3Y7_9HYPO|nr:mRNA-capping enzyme subunit beta [Trichoderma lentiforme]
MDLRSVLNTSDNNGDRAPPRPPPAAQQQQQQQRQQQEQQQQPRHAPSPAQYTPGEYSQQQQPPQASPVEQPAMHDYPHAHQQQQQPHPHRHAYPQPQSHHYPQPQQQQPPHQQHPQQLQQHQQAHQQQAHQQQQQRPSNAYPATSPFQAPGHYQSQSRSTPVPAPPPLQPPSQYHHDPRSPGSSRSGSGPVIASPYRPSPTSSTTPGGSAGYPFPTQQQQPPDMVSPIQRPYPSQYQDPRRDSYPQQSPQLATYQQQQMRQYMPPQQQQRQQSQPPTPLQQPLQQQQQSHAGPHQPQPHPSPVRTSSASSSLQYPQHSPTATQQHYGPYAQGTQGSPVPAAQPPLADYSRHPSNSQPPTPLGPPGSASGVRQPSTAFAQPPSPYQQRMSIPAQAQAPPQPQVQAQTQPSPKPAPPPPATPAHRLSSHSSHGSSPVTESTQHPRSQQGREQSLSVSPKTRLGSIPSNPDATPASADRAARSSLSAHPMAIDSDRAVTPAKRKLEDLNMSPGELEYKELKPPPGEVNGGYAERIQKSASPILPRKRRARHSQPPIWALSVHTLGRKLPSNVNFVLQKRIHSHINTALNGKHEPAVKNEHPSRQPSPEARRNQQASVSQQPASAEPDPQDILGPWEASIAGVKPIEELSKNVADFLFVNVVSNQDIQEITSRGIQFEIEAKLGTLIDKDTNQRVDRFVATECILDDNGRVAFRSSMTEAHHKSFNDYLNNVVIQTDPRNPNGGAKRVPVIYKHRREIDRFYDLPPEMHGHLPGCVRARLGSRSRNVRVRVTYDQKTNQILNKIIKARVADIDLHMPMAPMDCRISINLEMNWDGSVEELEQLSANKSERQPDRNKDRLSYKQGHYQIDLTQVTHAVNGPGRMDKEHELEIELNHLALLDQGRRAMNGASHRYQELVEGFVDNVRLLARKAKEFAPRP